MAPASSHQATRQTEGTILKTTDGGVTWNGQDPGVTDALNGLFFPNANQGWVVGDNATILRTTDGGAHWSKNTPVTMSGGALEAIQFPNPSTGWLTGHDGLLFQTTDAGAHWQSVSSGTGGRSSGPQLPRRTARLDRRGLRHDPELCR